MKLFDVAVPPGLALPTCPGNTPFGLDAITRIAHGDQSNGSTLHMTTHGGTHGDAPRRVFDSGASVDALALDQVIGRTRPRRAGQEVRRRVHAAR